MFNRVYDEHITGNVAIKERERERERERAYLLDYETQTSQQELITKNILKVQRGNESRLGVYLER